MVKLSEVLMCKSPLENFQMVSTYLSLHKHTNPLQFQIEAGILVCQIQVGDFFLMFVAFPEYMNFIDNYLFICRFGVVWQVG